jgi:hypothetical protein
MTQEEYDNLRVGNSIIHIESDHSGEIVGLGYNYADIFWDDWNYVADFGEDWIIRHCTISSRCEYSLLGEE